MVSLTGPEEEQIRGLLDWQRALVVSAEQADRYAEALDRLGDDAGS